MQVLKNDLNRCAKHFHVSFESIKIKESLRVNDVTMAKIPSNIVRGKVVDETMNANIMAFFEGFWKNYIK